MTAPFEPLVEFFLAGGWRDVSGDVRYKGGSGIKIQSGMQPQSLTVNSTAGLTLDNRSGDYSPRNPAGQWWSYLKRNTPIRIGTRIVRDLYTSRAASNGWGTVSQSPLASGARFVWAIAGGVAGDYAVSGGVGTHSLSSTASRFSYLPDVDLSNVECRVTFQLPFSNTTGGAVFAKLIFRGISGWYRAEVAVNADESVTVQFYNDDGAPLGSPTVVAGLTHSGQQIRVAAHMDGQQFRVKVWAAAGLEPYDWSAEQDGMGLTVGAPKHGWAGIESAKAAGNTNGTFSISYSNFEVINRRFAGETSEWPPKPDQSGRDITTTITAADVLRRYRANGSTLRSPAYRAFSVAPTLVAYWPGEEGTDATELASANSTWPSMAVLSTAKPKFAGDSIFSASTPLPVVAKSVWEGLINGYTVPSPAVIQLRWIQRIDISTAEPPNAATIIRLKNTGSAYFYIIRYVTGGALTLEVQDYSGTVLDSDALSLEVRNVGGRCSLELTQSGANVAWTYSITDVDTMVTQTVSGSTAGQTIGMVGGVAVGDGGIDQVTIGHITVQSSATATLDYAQALFGWQGETAPARAYRVLHTENGLPFQKEGDYTKGITMGNQPIAAPLTVLDQTAAVDQGLVWSPRFHAGIGYITYTALVDRAARLAMSYASQQMFGDLEVIDDDKTTVNSVTVEKSNTSNSVGSKVTRTQTTGPLSIADPKDGGVGLYESSQPLNVYTLDGAANEAGFLLMKGTLDQPRLEHIPMLLHNPRVYANIPRLMAAWDVREGTFLTSQGIPTTISADPITTVVIGSEERMTQLEHEITWFGAQGDVYTAGQVADSTHHYRVQASAVYLNATITSTATTAVVKSLDGYLLSTTAVPYDITMGGERMTVTACTGATSPQTLTVTRSVNGVIKAHTADDSLRVRVRIVDGARVALS